MKEKESNRDDSMDKTMKKKKKKKKIKNILFKFETQRLHGEIIGKLHSSLFYTKTTVLVDDLADALLEENDIEAIAVVDDDLNVFGVVVRSELFDLLSKPFGRDLYKNKPVSDIIKKVDEIHYTKNIFVVAEEYDEKIDAHDVNYFILLDENDKYRGIFNSRDILIYLSDLTMKDINMAKKLQLSIVKENAKFTSENLNIIAATKMAKGVGGDFYSAKKYSDTNWIVALADVSGKGVSASLISVTLSGMFNIYDFTKGIPDFIIAVNDYINMSFESGKFVTGIFLDINEKSGEIEIFDMGHSYTYIYGNKRAERIESPKENLPLGLIPGISPKGKKITLKHDELLIAVSDGIEEQTNINGEEYSVSRFMNVLIKNIKKDYKELSKIVFNNISEFRAGQALQDDMTYLVLKRMD
jgi:sigma-B regulation protein RsbU (phosphoserine phosphatase)